MDDLFGIKGLGLKGDWVVNYFDIVMIENIDEEWINMSQDIIKLLAMVTKEEKDNGRYAGTCSQKRKFNEIFTCNDFVKWYKC